MTELEKYERVNNSESKAELKQAILDIAEDDQIRGRANMFDATRQSNNVDAVVDGTNRANVLTRSYGIRQQALYLAYYGSV